MPLHMTFLLLLTGIWAIFSCETFASDENPMQSLIKAIESNAITEVKDILAAGADPRKIDYFSNLPSVEIAKLLIHNPINQNKSIELNKFALLVLPKPDLQYENQQYQLIKLLLAEGWDPNNPIILARLIHLNLNQQIIDLLFTNNNIKVNPNLFSANREIIKQIDKSFDDLFAQDPASILNAKYKNLQVTSSLNLKIPRIIHHVWVTNRKTRREIPDEDIQHVLDTKNTFSQKDSSLGTYTHPQEAWEHIVWTNDKSLIPRSVDKLQKEGIKVKDLSEIDKNFKLKQEVNDLIEHNKWGMASDFLRLEIINTKGGVYADLNYVFDRKIENEVHKYDFFATSFDMLEQSYWIQNNLFGSKAHHPILEDAILSAKDNLAIYQKYDATLGLDIFESTVRVSGSLLTLSYYKKANQIGNINVVYPLLVDSEKVVKSHNSIGTERSPGAMQKIIEDHTSRYKKYFQSIGAISKHISSSCADELKQTYQNEYQFMLYLLENDISLLEEMYIGYDIEAHSWTNPSKDES